MRAAALLLLGFCAAPALAVEGAASAEVTLGTRFGTTGGGQVAVSLNGELSPIEDRLWLVLGYGLLKSADLPGPDGTPSIKTAVTHLFSGGVDVSPHRQWLLSARAQGSPRAGENVALNPNALAGERVMLGTSRQSAGASGLLSFDTAGDSALELGVDAGLGFTWNLLGRSLTLGSIYLSRSEALWCTRPTLGASATLWGHTTLGVRAGYSFYSADPLSVGRITDQDLLAIAAAIAQSGLTLLDDLERNEAQLQTVLSRLALFDAVSGYPLAPVRFDLKVQLQHRFNRSFDGQVSWTYLRYVPTQGFGNVFALRAALRFSKNWRVWLTAALQYDEPLDQPSARTADSPRPGFSGHLSAGAELQL